MSAYYNELDKFAAQWLRELIKAGLIADGEVDERDIREVRSSDLKGFVQCHFFAGIGGWSYALRLAGWPDDRPVWTGSCPCQPYSGAGKGEGAADTRNLWPAWFWLIRKCQPERVFGEQVESAIGHGWLDAVSTDLEAEGYAVGAAVLGAHSAGAPHRRQRLWFVAHASSHGLEEQRVSAEGRQVVADATRGRRLRQDAHMADAGCGRVQSERVSGVSASPPSSDEAEARERQRVWITAGYSGQVVADSDSESSERSAIARTECDPWRVEPELGRVAYGVPHKLVEPYLRGFGNAIVPQVAQAFIEAYLDARGDVLA